VPEGLIGASYFLSLVLQDLLHRHGVLMAKVSYELYGNELVGYVVESKLYGDELIRYLVECKLYRDELVAS